MPTTLLPYNIKMITVPRNFRIDSYQKETIRQHNWLTSEKISEPTKYFWKHGDFQKGYLEVYSSIVVLKKPIIGWKKVYLDYWKDSRRGIVKLIIPYGAQVYSNSNDNKKRCDIAIVEYLHSIRNKEKFYPQGYGMWASDFEYHHGHFVAPQRKFSTRDEICDSGIHFFLNYDDAKSW